VEARSDNVSYTPAGPPFSRGNGGYIRLKTPNFDAGSRAPMSRTNVW
jgi:hypothetical protein